MKKILTLIVALVATLTYSYGDNPKQETLQDYSVTIERYDDFDLTADVFLPHDNQESHYCIIHSYGGGFSMSEQKSLFNQRFCRKLSDAGYVVIASDYRLGLKDYKMKGKLKMITQLQRAVDMAVEDIYKTVSYVLQHADEMKVRPDGIILCGSSSGAIISLQCDYELCNHSEISRILPEDFSFAGIIAFSGAILSEEGRCDYSFHSPAPTFMLHGIEDKLVEYDKITFFNKRFCGANDIAKRFAKFGWDYEIIRYRREGHGVSMRLMDNIDQIKWFLDNMVKGKRHFQIDITVNDKDHVRTNVDNLKPKSIY